MAAPAKRPAIMSALAFDVMWGTDTVGLCRDVDLTGLKLLTREKKLGLYDEITIDEEIYGMEGDIGMVLEEADPERLRQMMPWATSSGVFSINPSSPTFSMYANAKQLICHPRGLSVTTSDFQFVKAFPICTPPKGGKAKEWKLLPIKFRIFPDQTALLADTSTLVYGYQGAIPA